MALFNNGFPASYPQMYPQQYPQTYQQMQGIQQPQSPVQNSGLIWIQGLQAAKSFLIAPNTTVPLFDSEAQCIYLKSSDASGMPSLKILDYTIRDQTQGNGVLNAPGKTEENPPKYVTKAEYEALQAEFDDLKAKFESFTSKRPIKPMKKEELANE